MDTAQKELNEINDEMLVRLITQLAKPTVTLAHLKEAASQYMEDLEFRGAVGRVWRAVKVYRHAMPNGQVVYWPEEKGRAVSASGIFPDMPEGAPLPDYVRPNMPKEISKAYQEQEHKQEVKDEKLTRREENHRKSRFELVPISQTAALPMRPLAEGQMGSMQRGTIRAEVACAMFRYRDVRLSIDGVASLIPQHTRSDVASVISQITNGYSKRYFVRHEGATRFDHTYQWNHEFSYPFASRLSTDGEKVQLRNVDTEVEDDEALDHLPPQQLTEDETESEIARLIGAALPQVEEEKEEELKPAIDYSAPLFKAGELGVQGPVGISGCGHAQSNGVTVNEEDKGCALSGPEVEILAETIDYLSSGTKKNVLIDGAALMNNSIKRVDDSENLNVTVKDGIRRVSANNDRFRVALFDNDELVLHFGASTIELSSEQTAKVMSLLGPRYLAGIKAA